MSAATSDQVQHLPIGHIDILDAIVDVCQAEKAYRTISLFALISKHHHRTIQPRLARIKARAVLYLDDYEWRNKENDPNIEIVVCSSSSILPFNTHTGSLGEVEEQSSIFQTRVKASIVILKGRIPATFFTLWAELFPHARYLVFSMDGRYHDMADYWRYTSPVTLPKAIAGPMECIRHFNKALVTCCETYREDDRCGASIRFRLHRAFRQFVSDQPGQAFYVLRGITSVEADSIEEDLWMQDFNFRQADIVQRCRDVLPPMEHPSELRFLALTVDVCAQPIDLENGQCFYSPNDPHRLPIGYAEVTKMMDEFAERGLATWCPSSTIVFRLFILGHGPRTLDRTEMTPIFSTTYAVSSERKAIVIDRTIDNSFAKCRVNGECDRCRGAGNE